MQNPIYFQQKFKSKRFKSRSYTCSKTMTHCHKFPKIIRHDKILHICKAHTKVSLHTYNIELNLALGSNSCFLFIYMCRYYRLRKSLSSVLRISGFWRRCFAIRGTPSDSAFPMLVYIYYCS